jgi:N-carbamoyl-L-amino-acid hydrolase
MTEKPTIDGDRLWSDLTTMAAIGATAGGGSHRAALGDADREGRNLFALWAGEAGLTITADRIGNLSARREGLDPDLAPVVIGSHLDTQTPGGRFDGVLGVLAGLELVRALNRAGHTTRRPLEVAVWTNEEGARFQPGLMGSSVFAGDMALADALAATDRSGATVAGELARLGLAGPLEPGRPIDSYFELHIEQGPILEQKGIPIGLVTNSSWGCSGFVEIRGENGHTQTEAMSRRRNALVGAARLILEIDVIGAAAEPDGMVGASMIDVAPNNRVNIPHHARLGFAVTHATRDGREAMIARIGAAVDRMIRETGLDATLTTAFRRDRLDFSPELRDRAGTAATALGLDVLEMPTLTAHDALAIHRVAPVAILFVPCRDGVSHNEKEWCEPRWATDGARVLLDTVVAHADRR